MAPETSRTANGSSHSVVGKYEKCARDSIMEMLRNAYAKIGEGNK